MNKEQEQIEELKRDLEFLKKVERIQIKVISSILSEDKSRERWESKLLTELRGLAVECRTLIETKTKEMIELCGQ